MEPIRWNRREFLQNSGLVVGLGAFGGVSIVLDRADPVVGSEPVRWAASELLRALADRGVQVQMREQMAQVPSRDFCVLIAS